MRRAATGNRRKGRRNFAEATGNRRKGRRNFAEASAVVQGRYRYDLWRRWHAPNLERPSVCLWVMLNPSTADAHVDDPTIRRVVGFSRAWGFDAARVVNLFAYRATSPAYLWERRVPIVGPLNEDYQRAAAGAADRIVCAWGAARDPRVAPAAERFYHLAKHRRLYCLGYTQAGAPRHPLYVPAATGVVPYVPALAH